MRQVLLVVVASCGRLGFDGASFDAAAGDGNAGDDATVDAEIDAPPGAVTVRFGETPTADIQGVTTDTLLSNETPSGNFGASTALECEGTEKRVLLRIDVSSLAASTAVFSARLHVGFSATGTITIAPLLESWTEGTQMGAAGVANNLQRTATMNWTTPGALPPGSAGATIATFTSAAGWTDVVLPTAIVQGWISNPATNNGVLVRCSGDIRFAPRESATATQRPQLDITHL